MDEHKLAAYMFMNLMCNVYASQIWVNDAKLNLVVLNFVDKNMKLDSYLFSFHNIAV